MPESIILLAEDDENDIVLIRRAFDRAGIENPLFVVRDGEQAINYLCGIGKYSNRAEYPPHEPPRNFPSQKDCRRFSLSPS